MTRTYRMPDQRSTTEQLRDLASLVEDQDLSEEAAWLRARGKGLPAPSEMNRRICVRVANAHGMYDAADWVRDWGVLNGSNPEDRT